MRTCFVLSILVHSLVASALLWFVHGIKRTAQLIDPDQVDPAPISQISDDQLEQLDAAIEALERQKNRDADEAASPLSEPAAKDTIGQATPMVVLQAPAA